MHNRVGHSSSSDTNESVSGDSSRLFASAISTGSTTSNEAEWKSTSLPSSPSDPFNLLPFNPQPTSSSSLVYNNGQATAPAASLEEKPQATLPQQTPSQMSLSFRRLFQHIPPPVASAEMPQPQFVAPSDLSINPPVAREIPTLVNEPTQTHNHGHPGLPQAHSKSLRNSQVELASPIQHAQIPPGLRAPQPATRGLSGWRPALEPVERTYGASVLNGGGALLGGGILGLKPPCPRPSSARVRSNSEYASIKDTIKSPFTTPRSPAFRRPRRSILMSRSLALGGGSDDGMDEDDDDDVYRPSSSPTRSSPGSDSRSHSHSYSHQPSRSRDTSPFAASLFSGGTPTYRTLSKGSNGISVSMERNSRRGKGKAKGSAALALAVVTQMSKMQEQEQHMDQLDPSRAHQLYSSLATSSRRGQGLLGYPGDEGTDVGKAPTNFGREDIGLGQGGPLRTIDAAVAHLRSEIRPGRKRKNSTIPLPVPVPHLIKKSRGRKVPHIPLDSQRSQTQESGETESVRLGSGKRFRGSASEPSGSTGTMNWHSGSMSGGWDRESQAMSLSSSSAGNSGSSTSTGYSMSERSHSTDLRNESSVSSIAGPVRSTRGTRGRKSVATPYSLGEGGKRAYMCEVPGCGKCFVRGEHLKRHVRSIHTYDKREYPPVLRRVIHTNGVL